MTTNHYSRILTNSSSVPRGDWEASQSRLRMNAGMIIAFGIFFLLLFHCFFRLCYFWFQGRQQMRSTVENRRAKILDNISQMSIPNKIETRDEEEGMKFYDSFVISSKEINKKGLDMKITSENQLDSAVINHIITQTLIQAKRTENSNPNCAVDQVLCNQKECSICSDEYKSGDKLAWSKNELCSHLFHTECILPWLMNHSDCPMCRNDFLYFQNEA